MDNDHNPDPDASSPVGGERCPCCCFSSSVLPWRQSVKRQLAAEKGRRAMRWGPCPRRCPSSSSHPPRHRRTLARYSADPHLLAFVLAGRCFPHDKAAKLGAVFSVANDFFVGFTTADFFPKLEPVVSTITGLRRRLKNCFADDPLHPSDKFCIESGTQPEIDLATITDRMEVKGAVQSGSVQEAIEKINDLNPTVSNKYGQLEKRSTQDPFDQISKLDSL